MQDLTAPPRDHLSEAQVRALLTGDRLAPSCGAELLDVSNNVVADISDDLAGGSVTRDNFGTTSSPVHARCDISLARALDVSTDRVRLYMTLTAPDESYAARFDLGVFVPTTPDRPGGEDPTTYAYSGFDLIYLLQTRRPGDVYIVASGTSVLAAVKAAIVASGFGAPVRIDGTGQDVVTDANMVWLPLDDGPSWLDIINDLLAKIGYIGLFADGDGALCSRPDAPTESRPVDLLLDTSDLEHNIVGPGPSLRLDGWGAPNQWRFIRTSNSAFTPTLGDGIYVVPAPDGVTGIDVVEKQVTLDAADQASLVAQGDSIVAADRARSTVWTLSIDPLPIMGHRDVVLYKDWARVADETAPGGFAWVLNRVDKLVAASYTINLDGSPGPLVLGGGVVTPRTPTNVQKVGTLTATKPARVRVDGVTSDCPCTVVGSALTSGVVLNYTVGSRMFVTVQNPAQPLVSGTFFTDAGT